MRWISRLLPILLAAVLAVVVWWPLNRHDEPPAAAAVDAEPVSDYYLREFTLRRSDAHGAWEYRIQGANMLHFPSTDSWTLESPTMIFYSDRGAPWHGRAERGRVWAGGDEALLSGEVALWRPATADNRAVTIDTDDVYLKPAENYAETAAPVLVQQPGRGQLRGVGARLYLAEERYELLSRVEGHYAPPLP